MFFLLKFPLFFFSQEKKIVIAFKVRMISLISKLHMFANLFVDMHNEVARASNILSQRINYNFLCLNNYEL